MTGRNDPATIDEQGDGPSSAPESTEQSASQVRDYRGTGIMWTAIAVVLAIALAVVASFQNTQDVDVQFLWLDGSVPLVLLLLITVGTTVVVTEAVGVVWRHRRRKRLRERQELRKLRSR